MFPFHEYHTSNVIVGIVVSEGKCFSTKERVPYKIVFECLSRSDLEKYKLRRSSVPMEKEFTHYSEITTQDSQEFKLEKNEGQPYPGLEKLEKFCQKVRKSEKNILGQFRMKLAKFN